MICKDGRESSLNILLKEVLIANTVIEITENSDKMDRVSKY